MLKLFEQINTLRCFCSDIIYAIISTLEAYNHIAVHLLTNHNIDLDSAQCSTYSTNFWKAGALTRSKDLFTEVNNYSCNGSLQMTSTRWKLNRQMDV